MILEDATKEAFGYCARDLKPKSGKPIIAACELCGEFRIIPKLGYRAFCRSCSLIFGEALKGYKNPNYGKRGAETSMFGKPKSDETRALLSVAMKGKRCALGFKHTDEMKARLSATRKGMHFSEEHKCNLSKNHADTKGDKNGMWRGGISFEPYCVKFNTVFKEYIRRKFEFKCFLCSKTEAEIGQALDVHHVNYNKQCGCDNTKCVCVPLCRSCHVRTNANRDYWQKLITDKLHNTIIGWDI